MRKARGGDVNGVARVQNRSLKKSIFVRDCCVHWKNQTKNGLEDEEMPRTTLEIVVGALGNDWDSKRGC